MLDKRKSKHAGAVLLLALAAALPQAVLAAGAARIEFATDGVQALGTDGGMRPLVRGAEVIGGETIDTGGGRAQLRFTDGALVSLAPQTQFRIDDYRFSGVADGSERGFFSLLKGGLRTITGLVGRSKRDNYRLSTTVATIGIRGTEYSVAYGNSINVTTGGGTVEVCNSAGCLVLNSGETAYVANASTRPIMTDKKPELPPEPAREPLARFIAGEDTNGSGVPTALGSLSPAAMPVIPLANGAGGLAEAHVSSGGTFGAGLLGGTLTFAPTGELSQSIDCCTSVNNFTSGMAGEFGADGIIGWGRWLSGNNGGAGALATMNYVVGLNANAPAVSSIVRGYASFASTAPVITSGGSIVAIGSANSVTGTLNVNFTTMTGGGSLSYSLNIPVASQTFSISGSASQYSSTGFLGSSSTITSSGSGCATGCAGNIPFGNAIQGFFTGTSAERAGANYGFTSNLGQVSGAVVFK